DEWTDQPGPDGALMVGRVARAQIAVILCFVIRMAGSKAAQPVWRHQLLLHDVEDLFPPRRFQNGMRQRKSKELIWPQGCVGSGFAINDVVEVPSGIVP